MKTIRYFIMILLAILIVDVVLGNESENELVTGEIKGRVVDRNTREPLPYASVALLNAEDLSVVTGVISDGAGEYVLNKVPQGKYNLEISFIGYKSTLIEGVIISRKQRKIEVDPASLAADITELEQVSVTEERLKGEEKIDRTVFTINDDIRKASSSGIDMLKHIPSVTVDFMDNVSLEGQSDIQFYVDGVLRNKDFVAQLSPEVIDKVELITNPGVKYDSDISAVINIVLRKNRRSGINGSVLIPLTHPERALLNPRATLEYGNQKMRIYFGDRLHYERFRGTETLTTVLDNSFANPFRYEKTGAGYNSWQFNYMNYGADLFINDRTSLNFLGEWRRQKGFSHDYQTEHRTWVEDVLVDYHKSLQDNTTTNNNHFHSAYFRHVINDQGSEISAELNYYTQTGTNDNTYLETYYAPDDLTLALNSFERSDYIKNLRNTLEFKSDYSFVLQNIKNEVGVRFSERWMSNDFTNTSAIDLSETQEDNFRYTENWNAAYYNVSGKVHNFSWQAGLRAEYSNIAIQDTTNVPFFTLLPQVSLSQNFNNNQALKLSFRRKLYKPNIQDLNPFETWIDSLHIKIGNPDLRPAIENRVELSYSKNFGSNFVSPKLYLRYTQNGIQDLSEISSEGITLITRDNIGQEMEYGVSVSSALQVFKICRVNANVSVFNRTVSSNQALSLAEDDQMISYRFDGTTLFMLPKQFVLIGMVQYGSPNINYQREFSRDLLFIVGFEKQIGEQMNLSAFYVPFIKDFTYSKVITRSQGYFESWEGSVAAQHLFSVEFTYNFGWGGQVKKIDREVEYDKGGSGGRF